MAQHRYPRPGAAGASAQAIYEARYRAELRRHRRALEQDAAWREDVRHAHPLVGRIVAAARRSPVPSIDPATEAWAMGAAGERAVGDVLEHSCGVVVLHDRARPGSRGNLDHVVVAPSGVYVIDAKAYNAAVDLERYGCWPRWRTGLVVACRDRQDLLDAARAQAGAVERILSVHDTGRRVPVRPVLCFVGAEWRVPARVAFAEGVVVTHLNGLTRLVGHRGALDPSEVMRLGRLLGRALPPR